MNGNVYGSYHEYLVFACACTDCTRETLLLM